MRRLTIVTLSLSLLMFCSFAQADQTLQLPAFNAVRSDGIFDLEIVAGGKQSVVVKASDDAIAKLKISVMDGELIISGPEQKHGTIFATDTKIAITVPSLRMFKGKGVGEVIIKNIDNDRFDLSYDGIGSVEASGKTKWLRLKGNGVGGIGTKNLLADDADVDFDGVGAVEIYVSNHLNAVVHGIGSLTYFGNPKSINKSADGIGSISAGR
jgi:Putative auto-transporter adhesin, head GIN domain